MGFSGEVLASPCIYAQASILFKDETQVCAWKSCCHYLYVSNAICYTHVTWVIFVLESLSFQINQDVCNNKTESLARTFDLLGQIHV